MCWYTWLMAQLTLYIDDETARKVNEAAAKEGLSRSAWVKTAIARRLQEELDNGRRKRWLATKGAWKDDRTPEEILEDIRSGPPQRERASFD